MLFTPTLSNGSSVYNLTGGMQGLVQITYACTSYPSAGTVKLEYQITGSTAWVLATGTNGQTSTQQASAQAGWELWGAIANIRITFAGLSGGSGASLAATHVDMRGHPFGVYQGVRAITMQSYTEGNVKRGVQYEASYNVATLAAGASSDVIFTTGPLPVIMKDRQIGTNASLATASMYSGPTATAGTAIPIYNLCLNPSVAVTTGCALNQATVTATGTKCAADTFVVGTTGQAQNVVGTYMARGVERILQPNTVYLYRVTNTSGATGAFATFWSWYEGYPDFPLS